jgi:CubicO group peptidase (beta-lactamase class C family)
VINYLANKQDVKFAPGSKLVFSNSDYAVLVKIIEKKSKVSYKDYLAKNIFKKLKMKNTYFSDEINSVNSIAIGHFKEDEIYLPKEDHSQIYGMQGVYTNAEDYAKFDKALYTNKLLSCESLQKIFSVEQLVDTNKISYYGYAWVIMKKNNVRYFWHGGSGNGYSNLVLHLADTHTTVLLLTNRNDGYDFLKMTIYIAKLFDKNLKL